MGEMADYLNKNIEAEYFAHLDGDCGPHCEYCTGARVKRRKPIPAKNKLAARRVTEARRRGQVWRADAD